MLLLPTVSIGNVPQLAVDLLIHTYKFELSRSLDNDFVVPVLGPMDYTTHPVDGIATAVQLYSLGNINLVQIRSPPCSGSKTAFLEQLYTDLNTAGINTQECVIVSSANAGFRVNGGSNTHAISTYTEPQPDLPETGFANEALAVFKGSKAVVSWVYEGDNFADAERLAERLVNILDLPVKPFEKPVSWARVYGKEAPLGVENGIYS